MHNPSLTRRRLLKTGAAALPVLAIATPLGATVPVPSPRSDHFDPSRLRPGEFLWEPELSPDGPVLVIVSLPDQLVHVYRNGVKIGVSTCSTGKPGHRTPTGVFVVLQKDRDHHSSTYNNAPMPNMQRLTWSGIALHAGRLPGYPASHGCVRLPRRFSELLFGITHLGIPVIIADEASEPASIVHPGPVLPAEAATEGAAAVAAAAAKSHHGAGATTEDADAVSILISGASKTIEILRDGVVIAESPVEIVEPDRPLGNHLFKLLELDPGGIDHTWLAHRIGASGADPATPGETLSRVKVIAWPPLVEALADLRPGSSIVVTDLAVGGDARSDPGFVILDA